ncbi:MAG: SEC-C metal-binding domain-containing protein [Paracoccaceae bacterium]
MELKEKLGRNELCPCGSGRHFKRCCLKGGRSEGSRCDHFQAHPCH